MFVTILDNGVVAMVALEVVAPEMAVDLQVADERLDGGSAPESLPDHAMDTALLA